MVNSSLSGQAHICRLNASLAQTSGKLFTTIRRFWPGANTNLSAGHVGSRKTRRLRSEGLKYLWCVCSAAHDWEGSPILAPTKFGLDREPM